MKLFEIILKPGGLFGTPLVGDTLFGHLCWQFASDGTLLKSEFQELINVYQENPFCVVSSAFPKISRGKDIGYAMPRPDLSLFGKQINKEGRENRQKFLETRKEMKKQKWFFVDESLHFKFDISALMNEEEVAAAAFQGMDEEAREEAVRCTGGFCMESEEMHNSVNRLTGTTGEGFDPYISGVFSLLPGVTLALFVLLNEAVCTSQGLQTALERIGTFGYGRDSSSGKGRFTVLSIEEKTLPATGNANACYTLAPCVPEMEGIERAWFTPLTRFGKHGGGAQLGTHPFKSPVVMAEEGAVWKMNAERSWLGKGICGVSKQIPETVVQGFAPCLPCSVEA
ncbi:hypothetical protein JWG39_12145 [Desulforhopalus vacuolatus]|uniref:type III-A CRISPR-associated RAMP protein Csm4 n=1 Tax=Desulforhopalus vacuolatus TaxID=40414 RepID=UPI001962CCCA|nr:hypothetical protein [Desulforhopalus vacuolatus]MBM9520567.1 hypothetical protein [Desulforhopalus vacuolatus]